MKIVSWNVAGLRACEKKGFSDFVKKNKADVLGLQEVKALPEQLDDHLVHPDKYEAFYAPAQRKGYSGVATWVKKGIKVKHTVGLGIEEFDCEGRTLISEFENHYIINCYFPNGKRDHSRVEYKLNFSDEVMKVGIKLAKKKPVIIMGDYNTAHNEIDLANPKTNHKTTGFLPIEREWMDKFQSKGFVDLFRSKYPTKEDAYTWWTYRGDCRARNIGWRIDYFWALGLKDQIKSVKHLDQVMGSDHCPIELTLK